MDVNRPYEESWLGAPDTNERTTNGLGNRCFIQSGVSPADGEMLAQRLKLP